jgi:hypothetical protein
VLAPCTSAVRYNVSLLDEFFSVIERSLVELDCVNFTVAGNRSLVFGRSLTFMANALIVGKIAQKSANPQAKNIVALV